jgi:hypothetical protein
MKNYLAFLSESRNESRLRNCVVVGFDSNLQLIVLHVQIIIPTKWESCFINFGCQ